MPISAFDINGVLPPYVGPNGPGGFPAHLTPYDATAAEVVSRFATSDNRVQILTGWLDHREALRGLGFVYGFQFIDGSFVENKEPNDIDVVTYSTDTSGVDQAGLLAKLQSNPAVFSKAGAKQTYRVDAHFVDLQGSLDNIIRVTCYWIGLFSHTRGDDLWKGMLRVALDDPADDAAARTLLHVPAAAPIVAP